MCAAVPTMLVSVVTKHCSVIESKILASCWLCSAKQLEQAIKQRWIQRTCRQKALLIERIRVLGKCSGDLELCAPQASVFLQVDGYPPALIYRPRRST